MSMEEGQKEGPPWDGAGGGPKEIISQGSDTSENRPNGACPQEDFAPQEIAKSAPRKRGRALDRIGAHFSAINAAVVETAPDRDGYRAARITIKFGSDGGVTITPETVAFAPTEEEQQAILEEAEYCSLVEPAAIDTHALLDDPRTPPEIKRAYHNGRLYALYDACTGQCTMLQERVEARGERKKFFLPWTLWSDGRWLKKAAAGPFPFWGMDTLLAAPESPGAT